MKKLISIAILLFTTAIAAMAQKEPNLSTNGSGELIRYTASALSEGFNIAIGVDKNTKWIEYHNMVANQPFNNYVFLNGTKALTVFGYIPKDSLSYYRYNIIEDENKLLATDAIPFTQVKSPQTIGSTGRIEVDLGTFNIENRKLSIETYKITERSHVKITTIYNREITPAKIVMIARSGTGKKGDFVFGENQKDGFAFKVHDAQTVTALNLVIKPTDPVFVYNVYLTNLSTKQSVFISNNWLYDYFVGDNSGTPLPYIPVNASFFNVPGNYELRIIPKLPGGFNVKSFPEKTTIFHFTILPSDSVYQQKMVIRFVVIALVTIACLVFLTFYIMRVRNNTKLAEQKQQKDIAQLQLDAVRSQLNPHFLFNALSGIQNLINKAEIDQANRYLAKFARLTRNILNNRELIGLTEERTLLDDYLQMEQMRFGFDYEILTDPNLDAADIQIPAMLLQPFVENAVKHGVANQQGSAKITVAITKNCSSLELSIVDNGKGFDTARQTEGLGMQLSKKRIDLLNTIYKDSPIRLEVRSGADGTTVRIILTHWL